MKKKLWEIWEYQNSKKARFLSVRRGKREAVNEAKLYAGRKGLRYGQQVRVFGETS